jgi:putative ABC transport system permease protein
MPDWRQELRIRLAPLGMAPARQEEIAEELAQHLDARVDDLIRSGLSAAEAARVAEEELTAHGTLESALRRLERRIDAAPPVPGGAANERLLAGVWKDLRLALRSLRRSPVSSGVAVLTLTLSIGAAAAIFTFVNAVILRAPPFADAERLVAFWGTAPDKGLPVVNYPDALYAHYRTGLRTLESMAMYRSAGFTLTGAGSAERVTAANVTVDFFRLLGVAPLRGRTFLPEEERPGANLVAVASYGFWQRRFGGDPALLGQAISLNRIPTTVVGIMPPGFDFPNRSELWIPAGIDPQSLNCWCFDAVGRLGPGQAPGDVVREIEALNAAFWEAREPGRPRPPPDPNQPGTVVKPFAAELVGEIRAPMLVLLGGVGMVLLVACANLANLMLLRATARAREMALRCCLGASAWRIVRLTLAESLVLALLGAAGGLALAAWAVAALAPLVLQRVPHLQHIGLDVGVLMLTTVVTVGTVLLFSLAPAVQSARLELDATLRGGARTTRSGASGRLSDGFVVSQFALALVLLVGGGLLLRSFWKLTALDPGFHTEHVLVGRISLPYAQYQDPIRARAFFERLEGEVLGLPGVAVAGLTSTAPFSSGDNQQEFWIEGRESAPGDPVPVTSVRRVSPGYFAAIGTPLRAGRPFEPSDGADAPPVAIVDESLARRSWPGANALGRRIRMGSSDTVWRTVVGVAASVRHGSLSRAIDHYVYLPVAQAPQWRMDLTVRSISDPASLREPVRAALARLDPEVPMFDVHTLEDAVAQSLATRRLVNVLLLGFAGAGLLLAAIGIYGVMALSVASRTNEFGIRMALGAAPREILTLVLGKGFRLVVIAILIGLAGGAAATRFLGSLLFDVEPIDPLTFAAGTVGLALVALAACYVPARRATRTDPLEALREG